MKKSTLIIGITLFINQCHVQSQTVSSQDKWMEYIEEIASETEDTEKIETLYTELSYLTEHPIELNSVTAEELRKLPFLSDKQIENILLYQKRYGRMATLYELKNIEELDYQTITLLLPFVYISEKPVDKYSFTVNNLLKHGKNELQIRYDECIQQKKGYRSQPDSILKLYPNRKYLGEPFYHSLYYSYTFEDKLQFGVVGEKDAGEPFWNKNHKGYDYYSVHFLLKDIGIIKNLAIGDYKISYGEGLVISNDFTPSRSSIIAQAERRTNGFRRHFSTNETDFFRGVATTLAVKNMELSLFYSNRKMDAKVDSGTFTSIQTTGMHRLVNEREKLRTIPMQTMGGNFRYATPNLCIGLTGLSYSFGDYQLQPDAKPYNLFYFRGHQNTNIGVNYLLKNRILKFYGETAISGNGSFATLNAIQLRPVSYISLIMLHRYYDKQYQAYFGNAFSQNSSVQNEHGIYMGMQLTPVARWKLSAYMDVFRFPWLKYGVDAPSVGKEYMTQVDYTRNRNTSAYIRYRYRRKEKNEPVGKSVITMIQPYTQHRLRAQVIYNVISTVYMKTSADAIQYEFIHQQSKGIMLAQSLGWKPKTIPFQIDVYAAWFQTDDSDSRISSYEKNILYAFNMPSFYGKGIRLAASFRWNIIPKLSLSAKLAHTYYTNRETIGTDLEEIDGSNKTDLYTLLRWKF